MEIQAGMGKPYQCVYFWGIEFKYPVIGLSGEPRSGSGKNDPMQDPGDNPQQLISMRQAGSAMNELEQSLSLHFRGERSN
jgi:hypothetical protein